MTIINVIDSCFNRKSHEYFVIFKYNIDTTEYTSIVVYYICISCSCNSINNFHRFTIDRDFIIFTLSIVI